jgi:hypothetical protein
MALAASVLEQAYRYPFESSVIADGSRARLRLATSGGPAANPEFFRGRLLEPVVASDLLLTIGDVARARFHVPPAMLARILLLADPVATCADERLRFEAFSACCSVYGRADFLPAGFDGEMVGRGTTNVDMGTRLRAALAGIQDRGNLGLSVGESVVEVTADGESAIERRVPLPSRWVRGFVEVQAIMADLEPAASADGSGARLFFRSIPKSPPKAPVWVGPVGSGLRLSHHDAGRGSIPVSGIGRLRLFERAARHATGLRLYALGGDGSTGWQLDVPGGRLTIVLSPEVWRGFSGEGRALHRLAAGAGSASVAGVRAALGWEPRLGVEALAERTRLPPRDIEAALARLATSGAVGFDLADGGFFRRELPFDVDRDERLQPRLRDAKRLVAADAIRVETASETEVVAWVAGAGGVEYQVRSSATGGWTCTCPWYGRHRGDRGPCKHVLAVQLRAANDGR